MSAAEPPAGHGTEERMSSGAGAPQATKGTSGVAPEQGNATDVSRSDALSAAEPEEELTVGEDTTDASARPGTEPPD